MTALWIIFLILFYIFLGFVYLRIFSFIRCVYLGGKKGEFSCLRCGKCCKLDVRVSKSDVKRIEKKGYKDFSNGGLLKKNGENCIFLEEKDGFHRCRVYKSRPDACRSWPFFKSFLGRLTLARPFNCPGLARINRLKRL